MHNRLLMFAPLLMLAALLGGNLLRSRREPASVLASAPAYTWSEMRDIYLREQRLEDVRQAAFRFRETLEDIKGAVLEGTLPLEEAADRVAEAAQRDNPGLLRFLEVSFPGETRRGRVIRLLLQHLESQARWGSLTTRQREVWKAVRERWAASGI